MSEQTPRLAQEMEKAKRLHFLFEGQKWSYCELHVLESVLAALLGEIASHETRISALCDAHEAQHIRADRAEARCQELEAALKHYGEHLQFCEGDPQCDCGLTAALSAPGGSPT